MLDLLKDGVDLDKLGAAFFKFDAETGALQPLSEDELGDFDLEANQVGFTSSSLLFRWLIYSTATN